MPPKTDPRMEPDLATGLPTLPPGHWLKIGERQARNGSSYYDKFDKFGVSVYRKRPWFGKIWPVRVSHRKPAYKERSYILSAVDDAAQAAWEEYDKSQFIADISGTYTNSTNPSKKLDS